MIPLNGAYLLAQKVRQVAKVKILGMKHNNRAIKDAARKRRRNDVISFTDPKVKSVYSLVILKQLAHRYFLIESKTPYVCVCVLGTVFYASRSSRSRCLHRMNLKKLFGTSSREMVNDISCSPT